ncbi:MAG: hypothetical protein VX724_02525 [Chloroflexota bacterium]|nr:hypothetical protein [Chloroflexota bacterium]
MAAGMVACIECAVTITEAVVVGQGMVGVVSAEQYGKLEEFEPRGILSIPFGLLNLADQPGVHSVLLQIQRSKLSRILVRGTTKVNELSEQFETIIDEL